MLLLAAVCGVLVFRLLGTRTTFGRNFDVSAIQHGLGLHGSALDASNAFLTAVSSTSFVLIGGLLVGFSLLRRRFDLAAAVCIILGGSFATTELLKPSLPRRPGVPTYLAHGFPSGHSTVALALGLSLVLLSPGRMRPWAIGLAALYAAAMGAALVFNAWHLPSDVGGGFCVATAWAALGAQLVRRPADEAVPWRWLLVAAVLVAAAAAAAIHLRPGLDFSVTSHLRLVEAAVGIAIAAAACTAAFAYAIAARSASATRA